MTSTNELEMVEELETQLKIQMDVNAVLKDTLELTRQEKLEPVYGYNCTATLVIMIIS